MIKKAIFAILLCVVAVTAATPQEKPKAIYKVSRLSLTEVSISCTNGTNPIGAKYGDTLIISCGR